MQIFILAVIAILLVILFVWLLLREQGESTAVEQATGIKPVVAETRTAEPAADQVVIVPEHAPIPVVAPASDASDATLAEPAVAEPALAEPLVTQPAEAQMVATEPVVFEPAAQQAEPAGVETPLVVEPPAPVATPAPPAIDDLEIIEGIGPKIAGVLKQAGVTSFAQLAEMDPARISEILHAANLRLADPESWPEQARLAAAGDQAGLKSLQDRLKGGRAV